jgi:DNA-directed RNA polymerase subunit RPC12/RpoP
VGLGVRGYVSNCSHSFGTDCPEIGRQALPRHYLGPGGERYHPGPFHSTMPIATFCGTHQTHPTSVLLVHTNGTTTSYKKSVDISSRRGRVRYEEDDMVCRCAWCGKSLGIKPPYSLNVVTHGICPDCERKILERHAEVKRDVKRA